MIVFTAKLTKRRMVVGIIVACIMICSAIVLTKNVGNTESVSVLEKNSESFKEINMTTNDERVELLTKNGWEVDAEPIESMEVRIPEKFDGVYNKYNAIQMSQGLDLTEYAGERVMRYTYRINNHPSQEKGIVANLIVYKNKLIAGDICSPKLGGFMHGLKQPEQSEQSEEKN